MLEYAGIFVILIRQEYASVLPLEIAAACPLLSLLRHQPFLFVISSNSGFVSMTCFQMLPPFHLSCLVSSGGRGGEGIFF